MARLSQPDQPGVLPPPPPDAAHPTNPACPNGHTNPEGNTYCGTCGAALVTEVPTARPREGTVAERIRARRIWIAVAITSLAVIAAVVVMSRGSSDDFTTDKSRGSNRSRVITEDERAAQSLLDACRTAFAVPIRLEPSKLLPKMATANGDKAWFFDVYAKETDAWLAKATWQVHGGRESYRCAGAS